MAGAGKLLLLYVLFRGKWLDAGNVEEDWILP
jgi:hypothetical protein